MSASGKETDWAQMACHRCLVYLGDLCKNPDLHFLCFGLRTGSSCLRARCYCIRVCIRALVLGVLVLRVLVLRVLVLPVCSRSFAAGEGRWAGREVWSSSQQRPREVLTSFGFSFLSAPPGGIEVRPRADLLA